MIRSTEPSLQNKTL